MPRFREISRIRFLLSPVDSELVRSQNEKKKLNEFQEKHLPENDPQACNIAILTGGSHKWNSFTHWYINVVGQIIIDGPSPRKLLYLFFNLL